MTQKTSSLIPLIQFLFLTLGNKNIEYDRTYDTTQENISMHIKNIYEDKELDENRTYKKFLLVRQESARQVSCAEFRFKICDYQ